LEQQSGTIIADPDNPMTSRPSTAAPILAVLAVVLAMLGAYVGGYLWLGTRELIVVDEGGVLHDYPHQWEASIFQPAAWVESKLLGVTVESRSLDNEPDLP
jgi:hypothetical protein